MAVVKITFDSASVTSKVDADINHFYACFQNGKLPNVLGALAPSTSNNYITFTSGYVQVYGRRAFVEQGTRISISLDSNKYGYVILKFNLDRNELTLEKKEDGSNYPTLTQDNLMNGGTIYEFPLARYTKTTSSLTLDTSWSMPEIKNAQSIAYSTEQSVNSRTDSRYGSQWQGWGTVSYGTTYFFNNMKSTNCSDSIMCVYVGGCSVIFHSSVIAGSGGIVHYYYNGKERTISGQLTSSGCYLSQSDGQEPKYVRCVR